MNFFDPRHFPFVKSLEENWLAIREEARRQLEIGYQPYRYGDVHTGTWTTLELFYYDNRLDVRNRPRFTLSDCADPDALFALLASGSFEAGQILQRLKPEALMKLGAVRSTQDVPPELTDQLVESANSMVRDPELFITHQDRYPVDGRAPKTQQRLSRLVKDGTLVEEGGRYRLGAATSPEARDGLAWLHISFMEELIYPGVLVKGGLLQHKSLTSACPTTTRLLQAIPGLRSVWFSCLEPGAHILPHTGNDRTILRCHLGLFIPESCALKVGAPLFSQNDFAHFDEFLKLVKQGGDTVPGQLLRDSLSQDALKQLEGTASLERGIDPEVAWKHIIEGAKALSKMVTEPGFYSKHHARVRAAGKTPALDETVSRLTSQGLLRQDGSVAPGAHDTEQGQAELQRLNSVFLIEVLFPQFLIKDPRVPVDTRSWEEGKVFIFDDTQYHEAWNRSGTNRVILHVDVERSVYLPD